MDVLLIKIQNFGQKKKLKIRKKYKNFISKDKKIKREFN